jgi:hypothetical protein
MSLPVVGKAHEAKAGSGPFHWFIYGSSLDRAAFAAWAEQHGYRVPDFGGAAAARLDGYRLAFDVASRFWGGAVASLVEAGGESVEGLALPLPAEARGLVDHKEGAISGLYEPFSVEVTPLAGGSRIAAIAYRAAASRRLTSEQPPAPAFLDALIRGARDFRLSDGWVARLERLRGG